MKANRDHNPERTVGKAVRIDPYSKLGCVAELQIAKTAAGRRDAGPRRGPGARLLGRLPGQAGGEVWDAARSRRQVTRGELDHIALVPDPAYVGANILAVRSTT